MKFEITPSEVSELVPFSPALNFPHVSKDAKTTFAGISKNGLWMWVVCDTTINIYHTENSEWFGGYCFGESLKNPSAKITTVVEFFSSHIYFPCLLIAVNHDDETLICMYDINISKVVRSILVPDTVLQVEVVSGNGGACMETHNLFIQLRYMFGIVALGTGKGHVYLMDLCLDEHFVCDEHVPNITFMVKKYELLPERREKVITRQQHIFMLLNDHSSHNGPFEFESRNLTFADFPGTVHVSALKYIQNTVTLATGYNYGGIQLWDLTDLCILFTVANQAHELPIVAFSFQEPENDPRNFCYLWIVRGFSANERPEDFSIAAMYSLTYQQRTYVESFGNVYTDLQSCCKRFEHPLTSDPFTSAQSSSSLGSCILSCQIVCQTDESHSIDASSANDSDSVPENTSLCFLSWLVWSNSGNSPTSYHLALFDLNQWYQAQMPFSKHKSDPSHLSPYFAHFSLEEVVQNFDLENLLGLYAIPHSLKKFRYTSPAEEYFYPSSLDFHTIAYSASGVCKATFLGLQKSLLYDIADMGPNVLSNPKEIYSDLIFCGLVSDVSGSSDRVPLIAQRETIMQLALEYHLPFFFMKCLSEWRYADSIQEGCTSRALLNWAWKKVFQIKSSIDKLNLPLFNCSGADVDKASLKCLYSYRRQLDLIDTILMGYQKFASPRTEQGFQELKCRKDVVSSISMYLQVALWLHSVHVLPEVCEGEEKENNILYPVNALVGAYSRRRSNLQKIHSSVGPTDILLIDGLVREAFSDNTWQEKGGNGIYPPPSIYAALSCYLLDGVPVDVKHSLMYYLLLDISHTPHNAKNRLISEVKKFPTVFGIPQSISVLVKAFWYLDQFKFEPAIKNLLDPAVKSSDILQWQHNRVIKSFLFQKEPHKALKYINHMDPPENSIEDMKLHLSVLMSRGAITQAFDYQRSKQAEGSGWELLNHLFLGCQETRRLKDLMYLPLNAFESAALVKFLSENEDPRAQEALVMYYLLRCNFFEAAKVNEKLSISQMGKSVSIRERKAGRDALVEGLLASVTQTERNLVEEVNRFQSMPTHKGDSLQPLSLSVRTAPLKQISSSDILNSLISGASSSMCAPYLEPVTPLKSATRSFFDSIPFLRPPLTPDYTRHTMEAVFTTPVVKRSLVSPSSEFSSPNKKSRLLDNVTFRTNSLAKKKIPKHLAGDVATLLQSPPIHRRVSKLFKESSSRDSPTVAPQGILKKTVEPLKAPLLDMYTAKTPSLLSEDEDSSDETLEGEKMIVEDEVPSDVPGRQIRFNVPSNDELNTSVLSASDAESSMLSLRNEPALSGTVKEPSDFTQKLDALKSNPSLDPYEAGDRMFLNVPRRKALFFLTREPLKSHSSDVEKLVSDSFIDASDIIVHGTSMIVDDAFAADEALLQADTKEELDDKISGFTADETLLQAEAKEELDNKISEPDSYHHAEIIDITEESEDVADNKEECEYVVDESSNSVSFSVVTPCNLDCESEQYPFVTPSSSEFAHNRSGSSSGNSSYTSASERSLLVTPRRPLRDNSRNNSTSDLSVASVAEEKKDEILTDSEGEKHNKDISVSRADETPSVGHKETDSTKDRTADIEVYDISEDIPVQSRVTMQSIKELIDDQIEKSLAEDSKGETSNASSSVTSVKFLEEINYYETAEKTITESGKEEIFVENEIPARTVESLFTRTYSVTESVTTTTTTISEISSESYPSSQECTASKANVYDFMDDVPKSSIPAYVPIKERIRSSYMSMDMSQLENVDHKDDISISSSSSRDRTDQPAQEDVFALEKSDFNELRSAIKCSKEIESESESCDTVITEEPSEVAPIVSAAAAVSMPTLVSEKDYSLKITERFDFMSKNSDFYENNRLHRETMKLLQENYIPEDVEIGSSKSARKTRTFNFDKAKAETVTKNKEKVPKPKHSDSRTGNEEAEKSWEEFMADMDPESYEQFSECIQKSVSEIHKKKKPKNSADTDQKESSVSIFGPSLQSEGHASESKARNRKPDPTKKDTSITQKAKSSVTKSKGKGKTVKKMEFSFSEPHSPAGPEILEALTTPHPGHIGSFMFSPPLTRGRLRQKRSDDSINSSFGSIASDASFVKPKRPPVDPILAEIMAERGTEPKVLNDSVVRGKTKSSFKKSSTKKTKSNTSRLGSLDSSLDTSKLKSDDLHNASISKSLSISRSSPGKHTMVLRTAKPKTDELF